MRLHQSFNSLWIFAIATKRLVPKKQNADRSWRELTKRAGVLASWDSFWELTLGLRFSDS